MWGLTVSEASDAWGPAGYVVGLRDFLSPIYALPEDEQIDALLEHGRGLAAELGLVDTDDGVRIDSPTAKGASLLLALGLHAGDTIVAAGHGDEADSRPTVTSLATPLAVRFGEYKVTPLWIERRDGTP